MRKKKKTSNDNAAPTPIEKQALTVTELCERWGCERQVIMAAIKERRLKAFKLGKRTQRVAIDEVRRYERGEAA